MLFLILIQISSSQCSFECQMLAFNGVCNLECNTAACYYDNGECADCGLGCVSSMISDGVCDEKCFNRNCNYDGGDCFNNCNNECSYSMINDGYCDEGCFVSECEYDGNDCVGQCYPGCFDFMINDGFCEESCLHQECGFDYNDCAINVWVSQNSNGNGQVDSPFGTIQEALSLVGQNIVNITIFPGTYYINESIFINSTYGGVILQGIGHVQIRYLSPNISVFLDSLALVRGDNLIFDGSELWEKGCQNDSCRFIQRWFCSGPNCVNAMGQSESLDSVYVTKYKYFCFYSENLVLFTVNSSNLVSFSNVVIQNTDFFGKLVSAINSNIEVFNVFVNHSSVYSQIVSVIGIGPDSPILLIGSSSAIHIDINLDLLPYYASITNVTFVDINQLNVPDYPACQVKIVPGLIYSQGIDRVFIANIYFSDLNTFQINYQNQAIINVQGVNRFEISDIYFENIYLESLNAILVTAIPNYFSIGKYTSTIQNVHIDNSYIKTPFLSVQGQIISNQLNVYNISASNSSFINTNFIEIENLRGLYQNVSLKDSMMLDSILEIEISLLNFTAITLKNIQNFGDLISVTNCDYITISDSLFEGISENNQAFYIGQLYKKYYLNFTNKIVGMPSNIIYMEANGKVNVFDLDFNKININGQMVTINTSNYHQNLMNLKNNQVNAKSAILIINCEINEVTINNVYFYSSSFYNSGIFIQNNVFISMQGIVMEKSFSTAVFSDSFNVILKNSRFQNNFLNTSLVILRPSVENCIMVIDSTVFNMNQGLQSVDLLINNTNLYKNFSVIVSNSVFSQSIANSPVSISSEEGTKVNSIIFENITIFNTISNNCKFYLDKGIVSIELLSGKVIFQDSKFISNDMINYNESIPVVYYDNLASEIVSFENCVMIGNKNNVFLMQNNLLVIQQAMMQNSVFQANQGSLINSFNMNLQLQNMSFIDNHHINSLIQIKENSRVQILNSEFSNNSAQGYGSLIQAYYASSVELDHSTFEGNEYSSSIIVEIVQTTASLNNLISVANTAFNFISVMFSNTIINGISANNDFCKEYFSVTHALVTINNCEFTNTTNLFYASDSTISISNLTVSDSNTQIFQIVGSTVNLETLKIFNSIGSTNIQSSEIYANRVYLDHYLNSFSISFSTGSIKNLNILSSNSLSVSYSSLNLVSIYSIVALSSLVFQNSTCSISDSNFISSSDSAIQGYFSSLLVNRSSFIKNRALQGAGVYLQNSKLSILLSTFSNNSASEGGGIFLMGSSITDLNITNSNNFALFGNNIATNAAYLIPSPENNYTVVSGSEVQNISFIIVDKYFQKVTTDSYSFAELMPLNNQSFVQGDSKLAAESGVLSFIATKIYHPPGNYANFSLISSISPSILINFTLYFRECRTGEIKLSDNSCKVCDNNTYSLNISNQFCKPCPESAVCFGQDFIVPANGYWRDVAFPENFYSCMNPLACIQGSHNSADNCAENYYGTLCASCSPGYSLKGSYICKKCPDYWASVVIAIMAFLVIIALIVFLVYSNIKNLNKQKSDLALLLKILVNYCQTIMIFAQIDLKWPGSILYLFDFSTMIGDSSNQMLTLSCSPMTPNNSESNTSLYLATFFPFLLGMIAFCIWLVVAIKKRTMRYLKTHFLSTLIVIVFLMHTSISNGLLSIFSCRNINDKYLNTKDYTTECFVGNHLDLVYKLGVPGLLLWAILIPLLVLYGLHSNRKKLEEPDTKIKYKTLFSGYSESFYFWELLIILRKFCVRLIAIILVSSGITVQGLGIILILITALVLHMQFQPFVKSSINNLEFYCIVTLLIYAACGILFSTQISDYSKQGIGWFLFVINLVFLAYWAKYFFSAIFEIFRKSSMYLKLKKRIVRVRGKKVTYKPESKNDSHVVITNKSVIFDNESRIEADQSFEPIIPENPANSFEENTKEYMPKVDAWTVRLK